MPQLPLAAPAQHGSGNADQSAQHKCNHYHHNTTFTHQEKPLN